MSEPEITCPHCQRAIRLTETLAGPLLAKVRAEHDRALAEARTAALREASASAKAELAQQLTAMQQDLAQSRQKLAEAQQNELALRRTKQELEERQAALDLEVARKLDLERARVQESAARQFAEAQKLKDAEKEKVIGDLREQIENLKRRAEQGSQQLQGEVLELDLETRLGQAFPRDTISEVPKGTAGADCIQRIVGTNGQDGGTILWESKRTKHWSDTWLPKLRHDQRTLKAEIAVLVSEVLPKECSPFLQIDGVWITDPAHAIPLAGALRDGLLALAQARTALAGRQGKMQVLYEYLVGPQFRQRVDTVVEAFTTMRHDLEREKTAMQRAWAKREKQLERALCGMGGMYGDLEGIAGASMPELPSLELDGLPPPDAD